MMKETVEQLFEQECEEMFKVFNPDTPIDWNTPYSFFREGYLTARNTHADTTLDVLKWITESGQAITSDMCEDDLKEVFTKYLNMKK